MTRSDLAKVDRLYELAVWYKQLRETNNETFMPLFADTHRYLVLKGGGGSGKSIFAGRKILERATSEPGHRFLVCRKVARTLRESCFKQLLHQLAEYYPDCGYKVNKSDMVITFANGSEILFAGLDDVEKLKSIFNITGIWIEEASELLEGDFNQLDIRLRGKTKYYKQIIISFNPVSILHWLKKRFFDRKDPRARTHESTYKDNRFLDAEAKRTLEAFKETDEYYYTVYCLGMWGVTGKTVFNAKAIMARLELHIRPVRTGYFEYQDNGLQLSDIHWVDDEDGFIKLYREPEPGVPYVLGGDTAGEGSDSFVAQVLDNRTGAQVATLRHQFDEDLYARQVYCLGTWYNTGAGGRGGQLEHLPGDGAGAPGVSEAVRPGDHRRLHPRGEAQLRLLDEHQDTPGHHLRAYQGHAGGHEHRVRRGHPAGDAYLRPGGGLEAPGRGGRARRLHHGPGHRPLHPAPAVLPAGDHGGGGRDLDGQPVGGLRAGQQERAGVPEEDMGHTQAIGGHHAEKEGGQAEAAHLAGAAAAEHGGLRGRREPDG